MPELPDVEVYKRRVARTALNKPIAHVHVGDEQILEQGTSRQALAANLTGNTLTHTRRRGKYLGADTSDDRCLVLHFGMTGKIESLAPDEPPPRVAYFQIEFDDGRRMAFLNQRKLGRVSIDDSFERFVERKRLGPDALDLSPDRLHDILDEHPSGMKSLLMNQQALAGVGNVYSDEILFQAGISPKRRSRDLSSKDRAALHRKLQHVLQHAIEAHARPREMPGSWLLSRRYDDADDCPSCNGPIQRETIAGRTAHWCPNCQR